jgi:hypothetical protein
MLGTIGFVFFVVFIERVRGKERENESFTWCLLCFDEKHVHKKKEKKTSMQSETEENRAIVKQSTVFFFLDYV